jgi:hypothetical protein
MVYKTISTAFAGIATAFAVLMPNITLAAPAVKVLSGTDIRGTVCYEGINNTFNCDHYLKGDTIGQKYKMPSGGVVAFTTNRAFFSGNLSSTDVVARFGNCTLTSLGVNGDQLNCKGLTLSNGKTYQRTGVVINGNYNYGGSLIEATNLPEDSGQNPY